MVGEDELGYLGGGSKTIVVDPKGSKALGVFWSIRGILGWGLEVFSWVLNRMGINVVGIWWTT